MGSLNFGRAQVARLMRTGFEDTLVHNCVRNRCVVPQASAEQNLFGAARSLATVVPGACQTN
jgi:hypothetical protein